MEQKKKLTNAQLQKRIANALIHIDRTNGTESIFFSDKGLRLTVNEDFAIIATGFHRHVFNNFTNAGISRPYLYTKRVIEIANENLKDIEVDGGITFDNVRKVMEAGANVIVTGSTIFRGDAFENAGKMLGIMESV